MSPEPLRRSVEQVVPEEIADTENHLPLLPSDWTTASVRPETIFAALMQQGPSDTYRESLEESAALAAAVDYACECLSPEDTYVLNAVSFEGLTFDELAARLGVARSRGWRIHERALKRLRTLLINHEPIRKRLGMKPSWNAAAMHELVAIAGYEEGYDDAPRGLSEDAELISHFVGAAVAALDAGREKAAVDHLAFAAQVAVAQLRSIGKWSLLEMHELLCRKQSDYGHGNILKFGQMGVMVRASDKAERLNNLVMRDDGGSLSLRPARSPANESLMDAFFDIVGYAVIARMLKAETFELTLEASPETNDIRNGDNAA